MGKAVPEESILWHLPAITSSPSYKLNNIFSAEGQILRDANQTELKSIGTGGAQPNRLEEVQVPVKTLLSFLQQHCQIQKVKTAQHNPTCNFAACFPFLLVFKFLSTSELELFSKRVIASFLLNRSKTCRIAWLQELRCRDTMGWCSNTPKLYIVTGKISDFFFFFLKFRIGWSTSYSRNPTSLSVVINYRPWATPSTMCLYLKSS